MRPLAGLERCPLDQLLARVVRRLCSASLDELAALMLSPSPATAPTKAVLARVPSSSTRIDRVAHEWRERHGLTDAEADVLRLAARGADRAEIAKVRCASPMTVKTQVRALLKKVKAGSLHIAVERLLREAIGR